MDKNLLNLDIVNFKITKGIYSGRIAYIEELTKNNIDFENANYDYFESANALISNSNAKIPFRKAFEDYVLLHSNRSGRGILNKELHLIAAKRPLVSDAFYKLGVEKVRSLNYRPDRIRQEIIKMSDTPHFKKIRDLAVEMIGINKPMEERAVKEIVQSIYESLDIPKTATAAVLNNYFDTKETIKKNNDGVSTRYIEIIRGKMTYEDTAMEV